MRSPERFANVEIYLPEAITVWIASHVKHIKGFSVRMSDRETVPNVCGRGAKNVWNGLSTQSKIDLSENFNKLYNFPWIRFITFAKCALSLWRVCVFTMVDVRRRGRERAGERRIRHWEKQCVSVCDCERDRERKWRAKWLVLINPGCKNFRPHKPWQITWKRKRHRQHQHQKQWQWQAVCSQSRCSSSRKCEKRERDAEIAKAEVHCNWKGTKGVQKLFYLFTFNYLCCFMAAQTRTSAHAPAGSRSLSSVWIITANAYIFT